MLAYRYLNLSLVPFINDEPAFLSAAREQIRTGHWVGVSPLVGKQNLHYGPTVLWFYGLVHLLFGSRAIVHVVAMLTCMTGAHLAFGYGLGKRFGSLAGATALAFLASSPYQFFWSRLAWDQSVDVCSALLLFLLCAHDRITPKVGAAIGVVVGLAVSSHLMVLPLAFLAYGFLAVEGAYERRYAGLLYACGAALVVNLPYLHYLSTHFTDAAPAEPLSWDLVGKYALEPARVATLAGIDYFFDGAWRSFADELHYARSPWLSPDLRLVAAAVAAAGLIWTAVTGRGRRRVALLGVAAWVGYAFFFGQRRVGDPPHYQFATWWIIPLGLAAAVRSFDKRLRWGGIALAGAAWVLAIAQMRFTIDWMAFIRRHGGTQWTHYGVVLSEQDTALRALCADPHEHILVSNETRLFDLSLRYVASTEPTCASKKLSFCGSEPCPNAPGSVRAKVAYAHPGSAWLLVSFAEAGGGPGEPR